MRYTLQALLLKDDAASRVRKADDGPGPQAWQAVSECEHHPTSNELDEPVAGSAIAVRAVPMVT